MTAQSPNAYFASIVIHGLAAGLIFLAAYFVRSEAVNTKIIELVGGEGDNYAATVAPALGSPDGADANPADQAASPVEPPAPQPMEAIAAPKQTAQTAAKPAQRIVDLNKVFESKLKTFDNRRKRREEAQRKAEEREAARQAAIKAKQEADAAKAKEDVKANRMTKEEFDRKYGKTATARTGSNTSSVKIQKIDTVGIAGGMPGGSKDYKGPGAGGKALTREEADLLSAYFSLLKQHVQAAHERPTGVSDLLEAKVEFLISEGGVISGVHIVNSSGSAEFDQSVLSAFRNMEPMPPRQDNGGTMRLTLTLKMRDE
ncbi:MAG TPA: cell envelope integrity protein TolA [Opitutaceae bacterium]|nr:cell envelope integrity protein TolA [Opitutaceae bacterium]